MDPQPCLRPVTFGASSGDPWPLPDGVVGLGRDASNAIALEGTGVSRFHARLHPSNQGWVIEDLQSANGTWVNGHRVERCVLRHGDELQLGDVRLRFEASGEPPPLPVVATPPVAVLPPPLPAAPPPLPPPSPAPAATYPVAPPRSPARTSRAGLWVAIGMGTLALLAGTAWLMVGQRPESIRTPPPVASGQVPEPAPLPSLPAPSSPVLPEERAQPDRVAAALESRLRQGDLRGVLDLSHPTSQEHFRLAFEGHPERMRQAADLLATRRPLEAEGGWAEFEVRDGDRTFRIIFERVGTAWTLRSL